MITAQQVSVFARDTLKGLTSKSKFLLPKYFYDTRGSKIFQQIMDMPEYYLTGCEMEIFKNHGEEIGSNLNPGKYQLEIIELGSGDGIKSKILLRRLEEKNSLLRYVPVDISKASLSDLKYELQQEFKNLDVQEVIGDFFSIMKNLNGHNHTRAILFLGSNIGNFSNSELDEFMSLLRQITNPADKVLIGFDLKKSPLIIKNAYDDPHGHTRDFNLNHLLRINRELNADFDTQQFEHHTSYDPQTGEMKSYLVSRIKQQVYLGTLDITINFEQWEPIYMELSRKFNLQDIQLLAQKNNFSVVKNFIDTQNYFSDSLWVRI